MRPCFVNGCVIFPQPALGVGVSFEGVLKGERLIVLIDGNWAGTGGIHAEACHQIRRKILLCLLLPQWRLWTDASSPEM